MADRLEHPDFLLQAIRSAFLVVTRSFFKPLDGILDASATLDTEVDGSEMAFAELMEDSILLPESVTLTIAAVVKEAARFIEYRYSISILQFSSLVASDDSVINEGPVARQILENGYRLTIFILVEDDAVTI